MKVLIGPETPVVEIIQSYPGAEQLLPTAPAEGVTVADVAAQTGSSLFSLLHALREFACDSENAQHACDPEASHVPLPGTPPDPPDWVRTSTLRFDLNADELLAAGDHPMVVVRQRIAQLQPGEHIRMTATFRPAPLIDLIRKSGCQVDEAMPSPGWLETYIRR